MNGQQRRTAESASSEALLRADSAVLSGPRSAPVGVHRFDIGGRKSGSSARTPRCFAQCLPLRFMVPISVLSVSSTCHENNDGARFGTINSARDRGSGRPIHDIIR